MRITFEFPFNSKNSSLFIKNIGEGDIVKSRLYFFEKAIILFSKGLSSISKILSFLISFCLIHFSNFSSKVKLKSGSSISV